MINVFVCINFSESESLTKTWHTNSANLRQELVPNTCYISFRLLCSNPSGVSTAPWTIREAYWPSPPPPPTPSVYHLTVAAAVTASIPGLHRVTGRATSVTLHYFGLPCMAEVLQQQNVGHIIQVSHNLQLRCQNLKVGTCVMWRPSQDLERDPRRRPSPASILRAVEFRSRRVAVIAANHWRPLMLEGELGWVSMDF